jgi:hypothetical protein
MLFGCATALCLLGLSLLPLTMTTVTCGVIAVMVLTRFIVAAYQGLMALVAQENALTGRLAVVWQMTAFATALISSAGAGLIAQRWSPSSTFGWMALAAALISAVAAWKPAAVYGAVYDAPQACRWDLRGDLHRLRTHKAVLPAVLAMLMFQFSPGSGVVLQYYLVDVLHGTDAQYGFWYAVFLGSFMPVMLMYGKVCQRCLLGDCCGGAPCSPFPRAFRSFSFTRRPGRYGWQYRWVCWVASCGLRCMTLPCAPVRRVCRAR